MDEDKPLLIDLYFGGERSKGFALFRNTQVAFGFPEVASELVRDIFDFFDLFFQGKEIIITLGGKKEEIIIISGFPRV